jgi:hypothetical protein
VKWLLAGLGVIALIIAVIVVSGTGGKSHFTVGVESYHSPLNGQLVSGKEGGFETVIPKGYQNMVSETKGGGF